MIRPFSDHGKLALIANWGVDDIIRLTGPQVWREALAALDDVNVGTADLAITCCVSTAS